MTLTVHYNTIVHPFTLADNRHYTFYIFRILRRHPSIKYLAVPIYFVCAWAAIQAVGGVPDDRGSKGSLAKAESSNIMTNKIDSREPQPNPSTSRPSSTPSLPSSSSSSEEAQPGTKASFLLIYLLTTTLTLTTAPLVEPRYLIIPWLFWRLRLPALRPTSQTRSTPNVHAGRSLPRPHDHRLWLETVWFLLVNGATCYVFLYWGFEWPGEKGVVQRFMW